MYHIMLRSLLLFLLFSYAKAACLVTPNNGHVTAEALTAALDDNTKISDQAFYQCNELTSIEIPDTVTTIGKYAFMSSGLTTIDLPLSVNEIQESGFDGCHNLVSVNLGNVQTIGVYAFWQAQSLQTLVIPDTVTSIGPQSFTNLFSMTSLTIGSGLTTIPYAAFGHAEKLESLTIPDTVTSIGVKSFLSLFSLTSLHIGSGITSIPDQAFEHTRALTSLTIPNTVTSIGTNAFHQSGLQNLILHNGNGLSVEANAFSNIDNLKRVIFYSENEFNMNNFANTTFSDTNVQQICGSVSTAGLSIVNLNFDPLQEQCSFTCSNADNSVTNTELPKASIVCELCTAGNSLTMFDADFGECAPCPHGTEQPNTVSVNTACQLLGQNQQSINDEANVHTKTDLGKMDVDKWNILCEAGYYLHNNGTTLSCQECNEDTFKDSYTSVNIDDTPEHLKHHKCCLFPSQVVCIEMMKRYKEACVTTCAQ